MPSAFSHAFSAIALGYSFRDKKFRKMILLGAFCSVLPDADAISFQFGIPYSSMWGHRGITHSFFFAIILSSIVMMTFYSQSQISKKEWRKLFSYYFIATSLHPLLDAMTNGGLGVAFFAPFNNERYFFPFQPIKVSPISVTRFFTSNGLNVFISEFVWIWIPSIIFIINCLLFRKKDKILIQHSNTQKKK